MGQACETEAGCIACSAKAYHGSSLGRSIMPALVGCRVQIGQQPSPQQRSPQFGGACQLVGAYTAWQACCEHQAGIRGRTKPCKCHTARIVHNKALMACKGK